MTIYEGLNLLGVPAELAAGLLYFIRKFAQSREREEEKTDALELGVQALLRDRLYQLYRYCQMDKGYANIHDRENFENMFERYESLGGNGIMAEIHDRFTELPTKEEAKGEDGNE